MHDFVSIMIIFVGPALLGAIIGSSLHLFRQDKPQRERIEPTIPEGMYTTSDTDYLGRKEPTF